MTATPTPSDPAPASRVQAVSHQSVPASQQRSSSSNPPLPAQATKSRAFAAETHRRLAQEQHRREQEQRNQAIIAERIRTQNERQTAERERQTGTDTILPLDQDGYVALGGGWVRVRVHDNDVTSFDVWVNGAFYDDVRKIKGGTGTRTDETPIYSSGVQTLYYVWEISGKVNHCRLRVRDR
jgi:hypothetical protein